MQIDLSKKNTPGRAIRAKCLDCSGGSPDEVRDCVIKDCSLFPFRFGRNPFTKREGTKGVVPAGIAAYQKRRKEALEANETA